MDTILPHFDSPPLRETAIGVNFAPLSGWRIPVYGDFWALIRDEYPKFEAQPVIQDTGKLDPSRPINIKLISEPNARCWFIDESDTHLIQVQNDRFLINWRSREGNTNYPHFDADTWPRFKKEWSRFKEFLATHNLPVPIVSSCHLTYINHLDHEAGWDGLAHLEKLTPLWAGKTNDGFLPKPTVAKLNVSYSFPEMGTLELSIDPVIYLADQKQTVQMTLAFNGPIGNPSDLADWFDFAHTCIVKGFADVTSPELHTIWKRSR